MRPFRMIAVTILASCALVIVSSCTAATESVELLNTEGISIDSFSAIEARLDPETGTVVLPVDSFRRDTPEILALASQARRTLANACLSQEGFTAVPPSDAGRYVEEDRLYGIWSVPLASKYGFDLAVDHVSTPSLPEDDPDFMAAMSFCFDGASEKMAEQFAVLDGPGIDIQITESAYQATLNSDEGKAAAEEARECMTDAGLVLSDAGFPQMDYTTPGNSESNIRIATAQALCNTDTGAVQLLYDLTARYQAALMERHEGTVAALSASRDELTLELQQIIQGE